MIEPVGKYILVEMVPIDKSKGGMLLPDDVIHPRECNVMGCGIGVSEIEPADLVIIKRDNGIFVSNDQVQFSTENGDYRIIHEDMVLGRILSNPIPKENR